MYADVNQGHPADLFPFSHAHKDQHSVHTVKACNAFSFDRAPLLLSSPNDETCTSLFIRVRSREIGMLFQTEYISVREQQTCLPKRPRDVFAVFMAVDRVRIRAVTV